MRNRILRSIYLLPVILLLISYQLSAQPAPHTSAAILSACPGTTIAIPITDTSWNANPILGFQLRIDYDYTVMTFDSALTTPNPQLGGTIWHDDTTVGIGTKRKITIEWLGFSSPNIPNGNAIITLAFHYINGSTSIQFNNTSSSGQDCHYDGFIGGTIVTLTDTPTPVYYHDGHVSSAAQPGTVTGGTNTTWNNSTGTLTLTGYVGTIIKWQKQYYSGTYADISNTSATYSETPDSTGIWHYRAVVQTGSCSPAFSAPTTDTVTAINHLKNWVGTASINWKNSSNWSPPGIPLLIENVSIPSSAPHMPVIMFPGLGCNNIIVSGNGGTLIINPGFNLNINGTLTIGP